jgi:hypothetical protein
MRTHTGYATSEALKEFSSGWQNNSVELVMDETETDDELLVRDEVHTFALKPYGALK